MPESFIEIESISELHEFYGAGKPMHPLITVIDLVNPRVNRPKRVVTCRLGFYTIFCKKFSGALRYGRSYYDFSEGSLMFTAPGQATTPTTAPPSEEGWALFFH